MQSTFTTTAADHSRAVATGGVSAAPGVVDASAALTTVDVVTAEQQQQQQQQYDFAAFAAAASQTTGSVPPGALFGQVARASPSAVLANSAAVSGLSNAAALARTAGLAHHRLGVDPATGLPATYAVPAPPPAPAPAPPPPPPEPQHPTFVNAKQYRRIIKRREARARLEEYYRSSRVRAGRPAGRRRVDDGADDGDDGANGDDGGAGRRPYLHESRHRHAMKRPRGPGGRFLTKEGLAAYYAAHPEEDPSNRENGRVKNDDDRTTSNGGATTAAAASSATTASANVITSV